MPLLITGSIRKVQHQGRTVALAEWKRVWRLWLTSPWQISHNWCRSGPKDWKLYTISEYRHLAGGVFLGQFFKW